MKDKLESYDELKNCTFVKTILMILVLFYHSIVFWTGNWFTKNPIDVCMPLGVLASWLNSFHIYGFTLVSGYLFYYLKVELGKYSDFLGFVKNKAQRLLVPYAFVAIAWVIPVNLIFYNDSFSKIFTSFALGTNPGQLWFLLMIFWVFIIFHPLSTFMKNKTVLGFLLLALIYVAAYVLFDFIPAVFNLQNVPNFLITFWIGFKIRQFKDTKLIEVMRRIPSIVYIILHIALFAFNKYVLATESSTIFKLLSLGFSLLTNYLGAVMIFFVLQNLAKRVRWDNKVFSHISKCSMPIYLFHQQLVYFVIYPLNGIIMPYLLGPITAVLVFAVSLLISSVLLKFKATRFLIGEK